MNSTDFCYTAGALDSFVISGSQLAASGWSLSLEAKPVTELRLTVGDLPVSFPGIAFQPSPDVETALYGIPGSGSCRFAFHAALNDDHLRRVSRRELISITSYVDGVRGVPMERIWPPIVSAPPAADSDQVGGGDFSATSFSFLTLFRLVAQLGREESILDAGCGIGRMAFALSHYLGEKGRYEGFDVSAKFVDMARARFRGMGNFRFQHADIFNKMYNPRGRTSAARFEFPFASGSFSFAFLTSVFTHMLAVDVGAYLREVRRTLRRDGRCLATFFIIDDEADALLRAGRSTIAFAHPRPDGSIVHNLSVPENAVAYREAQVRSMIKEAGMEIHQLHRGSWPGRSRFLSYQDLCLLKPA